MRWKVILPAMTILNITLSAQPKQEEEIVLKALGAVGVEQVDEDEFERMVRILRHPVRINSAGRRELEACGLLASYQIASLEDYIDRHGPVMSFEELSHVDGFSSYSIECLKPFLSLETVSDNPLKDSSAGVEGECSVRSSFRHDVGGSCRWDYAIRGRISVNDAVIFSAACSREYSAPKTWPSLYSVSFLWRHGRGVLVAGDFNARFGQGLCLWNTMTFSSLSSPASFMKRPSGLSSSYSFKGKSALTGLSADISAGRWKMSFILNAPGVKNPGWTKRDMSLQPAFNLTRRFDSGHVGFTHSTLFSDVADRDFRIPEMKSSVDLAVCLKGVNIFGEAMYDWVAAKPSLLTGFEMPAGEHAGIASLVRYLPLSGEYGISASGEISYGPHNAVLSADVLARSSAKPHSSGMDLQGKVLARWQWKICGRLDSEVRVSERLRTWGCRSRTDARLDMNLDIAPWALSSRLNLLRGNGLGMLAFVEASYARGKSLKLYLRQGVFRIDDWDDRIYVYERDAPGNFNVPAFYGRGLWTSGYLTWRFHQSGSFCFRASYVSYVFMPSGSKNDRLELKVQLSLRF